MAQIQKRNPPVTQKRHGYNLGRFGYYKSNYPFINICKNTYGYWGPNSGPLNSNRWPTALPAGQTAYLDVASGLDPNFGYFPAGNYVVKSTSAATISVANSGGTTTGLSSIVPGVHTCTFTMGGISAPNWGSFSLRISLTNNTAGPIAINDLYCCLASEEASLLAGEICKADWVALHSGPRVVRFLDWISMNSGWGDNVEYFSDMASDENNAGWGGFADGYQGVPISVCMKVAKKLGAEPHFCMPTGFNASLFYMNVTTNKIHHIATNQDTSLTVLHHRVNGDPVRISYTGGSGFDPLPSTAAPLQKNVTYYVVNATATDYQLALTPGGAAIDFTGASDAGQVELDYAVIGPVGGSLDPYNNLYLPFAQACYAADPNATVHVEFANEVWNQFYRQYNVSRFQASFWATGADGDVGSGQGKAMLLMWKAFETVYPPNQVKLVFSNQAVAPSNPWSTVWDYQDITAIYGDASKTVAQIMNARSNRALYEFAPYAYLDYDSGQYTGNYYSAGYYPDFVYANNGNSFTIPDSYWDARAAVGLSEAQYQTQISVAKAKEKAPNIQCSTYEWGVAYNTSWGGGNPPTFNNHNGGVLTVQSWKAWLDGPKGKVFYQNMFKDTVVDYNLYCALQLQGPMGWGANEFGSDPFGSSDANPATESQRNAWFKTV